MERRDFMRRIGMGALAAGAAMGQKRAMGVPSAKRPNILFAISDDQSFAHAGAMGDPAVKTPVFDRVAREGALFTHAFCSTPSCTPSRGAILTGRHFWELEEGGNLWSTLPAKFETYPEHLAAAGYRVGQWGKGWGPGDMLAGGRKADPNGPHYESFQQFHQSTPKDQPFCFWWGSHDPHRPHERGAAARAGMDLERIEVPGFLPDTPETRQDIADYLMEVQRFDQQLGEVLAYLQGQGELDNTLVVVTSDNGMPFPRAKANCYDYGVRMPLAMRWPRAIPAGRVCKELVSHVDLAATFLHAVGLDAMGAKDRSILRHFGDNPPRDEPVFFGRERHAWARAGGVGYPIRGIRTKDFLYLENHEPERWPAGDPSGFFDVDRILHPTPTRDVMIESRNVPELRPLYDAAFGKRPARELYDCRTDPWQLHNEAESDAYKEVLDGLRLSLHQEMTRTGDPRARDGEAPFDSYPYFGQQRPLPPPLGDE